MILVTQVARCIFGSTNRIEWTQMKFWISFMTYVYVCEYYVEIHFLKIASTILTK